MCSDSFIFGRNTFITALEWLTNTAPQPMSPHQSTAALVMRLTLDTSVACNIEAMLEIIKIYCKRDVPPLPEMVQLIVNMGFDEATARKALRATKNNQVAACEWLVDNQNKLNMAEQSHEMPGDSPILLALFASPHIQLSLSSPKMFLGKRSIACNPMQDIFKYNIISSNSIPLHTRRLFNNERVAERCGYLRDHWKCFTHIS